MRALPRLRTARFFSRRLLTGQSPSAGRVVPVALAPRPELVPLPYDYETFGLIVPEVFGEWREVCHGYRAQLDAVGFAPIASGLAEVSEKHGGRLLILLGWEDPELGLRCHRHVFADWWFERTGDAVTELTDDGRELARSDLPKQARPIRPRKKGKDHRERGPWPGGLSWPMEHEEVAAWLESRYWQFARTMPQNPHAYSHVRWNPEDEFRLVVLHLREHGYVQRYGDYGYVAYDAGGFFVWTMGADVGSTVLINRKPLSEKPEGEMEEHVAEETLFEGTRP